MVIKESPLFTTIIQEMMSDDEYRQLQELLVVRPTDGVIIRGSGGLRKLRWNISGKGKRGGARIIYYYLTQEEQIYMLYAYQKNKQTDLTSTQLKKLHTLIKRG